MFTLHRIGRDIVYSLSSLLMFYYFQTLIRRLLLAVDPQQKPNLPRKVRKLNIPLKAYTIIIKTIN